MRYEDWDILLFPRDCKIPVKEFKTACHVVHDGEFSHTHGSFGIPTVCCFVPSLPPGTPFQISIHSWTAPSISQLARSYSKYSDAIKFEARLFIDGRLVASTSLDRKSTWPHVIAHSFEFSKNGDLEALKFPVFRQEILQQNYWSPADDLGRIKIVISEGFPRDSLSMPIERVKNLVAFSFQHAPLEILESSSIAWPNPDMWKKTPFTASMPVPNYSSEDVEAHAHSPRRRTGAGGLKGYPTSVIQGIISNNANDDSVKPFVPQYCGSSIATNTAPDPFGDANAYFEWLSNAEIGFTGKPQGSVITGKERIGRKSSTDVSMPDYVSSLGGQFPVQNNNFTTATLQLDEDVVSGSIKAPTNTPTTADQYNCSFGASLPMYQNTPIPPELASSLTNSLLNQPLPAQMHPPTAQPAPEVKSRKENRLQSQCDTSLATLSPASLGPADLTEMRKVSQQLYISSESNPSVASTKCQTDSPDGSGVLVAARNTPSSQVGPGAVACPSDDTPLRDTSGNSMDKGTKRVRNFTPASAKAIDDEDEPRRASPRVRLTPLNENIPDNSDV